MATQAVTQKEGPLAFIQNKQKAAGQALQVRTEGRQGRTEKEWLDAEGFDREQNHWLASRSSLFFRSASFVRLPFCVSKTNKHPFCSFFIVDMDEKAATLC